MKKIILLLFLISIGFNLKAQSLQKLFSITNNFVSKSNFDSAYVYSIKSLAQAEKEFGNRDSNYVKALFKIFDILILQEKWVDAEKYMLQSNKIILESNFGKKNSLYLKSLYDFSAYYFSFGNFKKAIAAQTEYNDIVKEIYGAQSQRYANGLDSLGTIYEDNANYSESEKKFKEAITIVEKKYGTNNEYYINFNHNLADLYFTMARYSEAEPLFLKVIMLGGKMPDSLLPDFPIYYNNLARLYLATGRYDEAEPLFRKSYELYLAKNNSFYLSPYANLGSTYFLMGKNSEALEIFLTSSEKQKVFFGEENIGYASDLRRLSMVYASQGNLKKAEELANKIIPIFKEVVGESHPFYASSLNNLANIYIKEGKFKEAESLYLEALNIRANVEGKTHPSYANSLINLATYYFITGDFEKSKQYFKEDIGIQLKNIQTNFSYLSEFEKEKYWAVLSKDFNLFYSFAFKTYKNDPAICADVFNNLITTKSLLFNNSFRIKNTILNSKDSSLISQYDHLNSMKYDIGKYILLGKTKTLELGINLDSLNNAANLIEKEISSKSSLFLESNSINTFNWKEIQKNLKKNEAVVEFLHFNNYKDKFTDSTYYCALVLRPGFENPKMVYLFEEAKLNDILNKMTSNRGVQILEQPVTKEKSRVLYDMIWLPLDSLLKGVKSVYLSPDGLLNRVSFSSLTNKESKFLFDLFNLNFISSTNNIKLDNQGLKFSKDYKMAIYGGIQYNMDIKTQVDNVKPYKIIENPTLIAFKDPTELRSENRGEWNYLSGTLAEAMNIQKELSEKNIKADFYSASTALEESFKSFSGNSPSIIHVATHGFFIPSNTKFSSNLTVDNEFRKIKNPLFRSGLILAGANRAWKNDSIINGIDDGILTAYEVSLMDLSNTKLVVLSACESGLGEIKGSEGVYGLQRAFKMAGVKYIIMTLWEIQDEVTVEFMTEFYKTWLTDVDIHEAFKSTQDKMRKKYEANYWAAFVLKE